MTARLRAGQLFALTIGLLVVFAIGGFVAGNRALDRLGKNRRLVVDRIDPALVSVQRYQTDLIDQETGVRGFALGADEVFLQPYLEGSRRAPRELAVLFRLTGHRQEAVDVAAAARRWERDYAEPTIAAVRAGQTDFETREVLRGKAFFDALRGRVDALERALGRERTVARRELAHSAGVVRTVVLAFTLAIFLTVLAAAFGLRRFIVRPLGDLARHVRVVAEGDFDHHLEGEGAREVVELGADVDTMRARIVAERDELARSNAELEQFAYVASHDLQEPLRKVASFTQMLQHRYAGQLDERADTYIEFAVDGAKRMQELINDLLAFSRVGRITEAPETIDANLLVDRALRDLELGDASISIDELPEVTGEARLLELVFANLVGNAIKFRGERPARVSVTATREDDAWCFTVADDGIGIEPEYADRIFTIFQRLHPRSAYDGTGIGLALARKIVEFHGGRIWLDTEVERGAAFCFTLPAS